MPHSHAHYILVVPESRFDHDTEESGEDMDEEEEEEEVEEDEEEDEEAGEDDATPPTQTHSPAAEENYIPDSPPISPVELKKELPKYLPALQVKPGFRCRSPGGGHQLCSWCMFSSQGCRSVEEFQCLNRIEEGTYGVVYRAKDKKTGLLKLYLKACVFKKKKANSKVDTVLCLRSDEIVALKRLKMEKEKEGFPITSLREINTILKAQHPNIVTVRVRGA